MFLHKRLFFLVLLGLVVMSGCAGEDTASRVPSDFSFMMDVRSTAEDMPGNIHVNVKVDAKGKGQFQYYDSDSGISYDLNDVVTYDASRVIKSGKFRLTDKELGQLWDILGQNHFFELEEHYEMALGHSFAFLLVQANDKRYIINNIGMEVPEIRAIVEATRALLPQEIKFEYGEGFKP